MSGPDHEDSPARTIVPPDLSELTELTEILLATSDVERALGELAGIAAGITPDAPMAGGTLRHAEHVMTVASSDAHALMIDTDGAPTPPRCSPMAYAASTPTR
ncbi:hypothetical protein [Nonomuraea sp. KM90]|uniref:hypothetical protein n=1 Tax=Nonomuraea sp. KM90 TaxID=3457428 RepID=UPI003FCDF9BA